MGRIAKGTTAEGVASRTELQLRELDRKALRAQQSAAGGARGIVPGGLVLKTAAGPVTSGTTPATGAAPLAASVTLPYGRSFEVRVPNLGFNSPAAGFVIAQINYTLDGTDPTSASPILDTGTADTSGSSRGLHMTGVVSAVRPLGVDDSVSGVTLKVLVVFWAGLAGTYTCVAQPSWPAKLIIEDKGPAQS